MNLLEWPPAYQVKRHPRTKRVKLQIDSRLGLVVTLPVRYHLRHLPSVLDENKDWILSHLKKCPEQNDQPLPDHIYFPFQQKHISITYERLDTKLRLFCRQADEMVIMGQIEDHERCKKVLSVWLREWSKNVLPEYFKQVSEQTGLLYRGLTIRNQKTVWGSCTAQQHINLNYKLIFLPDELIRYVMIHELCHTRHLNHSLKFWQLVEKHDPAWRQHWLALKKGDHHIPDWVK